MVIGESPADTAETSYSGDGARCSDFQSPSLLQNEQTDMGQRTSWDGQAGHLQACDALPQRVVVGVLQSCAGGLRVRSNLLQGARLVHQQALRSTGGQAPPLTGSRLRHHLSQQT